jgi:hypothetical protein
MSTTKILFMAGTAAVALSAFAFRPALATVTTATSSFTVSTATVETVIDTPVTKQVNTFSTELTAQMQGGPVLYNQTFPVAFADPIFQSAIGNAESVLTGAGAVSFLGPTLTSSTNTTSSTTNTVQTGITTNTSVTTTLYFGPQTINVGDFGVCQSYPPPTGCTIGGTPFTLAAGQTDVDTFTLTLVDIFTTTTTTNTDLLTQDYNLVGVPLAVPVPEPPAWFVLAMLLVGTGYIIGQKIKERVHPPLERAAA